MTEFSEELTLAEWTAIGQQLRKPDTSLWVVGDWFIFGAKRWEEHVAIKVAIDLGFDQRVIATSYAVCKRIPRSRRGAASFEHHFVVAHLHKRPERMKRYLRLAEREDLTPAQLRAIVAQEEQDLAVAGEVEA